MNSNGGINGYDFGRNVYNLYDCAAEFMEDLDKRVTYEYADDTYHTVTTKGGSCSGIQRSKDAGMSTVATISRILRSAAPSEPSRNC